VAGLHRRPDQDELTETVDTEPVQAEPAGAEPADAGIGTGTVAAEPVKAEPGDDADTPDLDVPVIGAEAKPEPVANGRPRPSAKRRDAGTVVTDRAGIDEPKHRKQDAVLAAPEPADEPELDTDSDSLEAGTTEEEAPQPPNLTLPIALVVVALLLGGLAFWFAQQLSDARVGSGNAALADVNATKDVAGAAKQAVTSVLSYKFDDMQNSTNRAKEYLDGEAVGPRKRPRQSERHPAAVLRRHPRLADWPAQHDVFGSVFDPPR
jgi:hypothetical protein